MNIVDPFAYSLNGTIYIYGYFNFAQLSTADQYKALLLPKKGLSAVPIENVISDAFENNFCSQQQQLLFGEGDSDNDDERDYLLPEEFIRKKGEETIFANGNSNGSDVSDGDENNIVSEFKSSKSGGKHDDNDGGELNAVTNGALKTKFIYSFILFVYLIL